MPDLELAQTAFQRFRCRCFWNLRPDLVVDNDTVNLIVKGLRNHGGREGWLLADQIVGPTSTRSADLEG